LNTGDISGGVTNLTNATIFEYATNAKLPMIVGNSTSFPVGTIASDAIDASGVYQITNGLNTQLPSISNSYSATSGYSVVCMFKMASTAGTQTIFNIGTVYSNTTTFAQIFTTEGTTLTYTMFGVSPSAITYTMDSNWHQYILTCSLATSTSVTIILYIDGVSISTYTASIIGTVTPAAYFIANPTFYHHLGRSWTGNVSTSSYMNDYMIYERSLSATEVTELYGYRLNLTTAMTPYTAPTPPVSTSLTTVNLYTQIGAMNSTGACMTYSGDRVYQSFLGAAAGAYSGQFIIAMTYPFATTPFMLGSSAYPTVMRGPFIGCNSDASIMRHFVNNPSTYMMLSTDYGLTWTTEVNISGMGDLQSISCDMSCNTFFGTGYSPAKLFIRTSNAVNFTASTLITSSRCNACAVSSDGNIVAVATSDDPNSLIYISINRGVSFSSYAIGASYASTGGTAAIAISDNVGDVYIYVITQYGFWIGKLSAGYTLSSQVVISGPVAITGLAVVTCNSLACSATGKYVLGAIPSVGVISSINYGVTFTKYNTAKSWRCAVISKDGSKGYATTQNESGTTPQFYFNNFLYSPIISATELFLYYNFSPTNKNGLNIANNATGSPVYDASLNGASVVSNLSGLGTSLYIPIGTNCKKTGSIALLTTGLTFSVWIYILPTVTNAYAGVFWFNANPTAATPNKGFSCKPGSGYLNYSTTATSFTAPSLTASAWHHIVWTISTPNSTAISKLYIDNALIYTSPSFVNDTFTAYNVCFGQNLWGDNWGGYMNEFRAYNRVITTAEITTLYTATYYNTFF